MATLISARILQLVFKQKITYFRYIIHTDMKTRISVLILLFFSTLAYSQSNSVFVPKGEGPDAQVTIDGFFGIAISNSWDSFLS